MSEIIGQVRFDKGVALLDTEGIWRAENDELRHLLQTFYGPDSFGWHNDRDSLIRAITMAAEELDGVILYVAQNAGT